MREAVELYRGLAAQHPNMFKTHLIDSLRDLITGLRALGENHEVIAALPELAALCKG
jgi:hypothetical protein